MRPILAGVETEYGLLVEGRGAHTQLEDARDFVEAYPGLAFIGWDYSEESPRNDLRGFVLERLASDPVDRQFDEGRPAPGHELRADRVLPNGARFYNDHGHPEYATPECFSSRELAMADKVGERVVLAAARAYTLATGWGCAVYKNNTDYHGASYGTHESYLAPRRLGFPGLYRAVTPILVARQVLCGAGKVGSESGPPCRYQLSQRSDFLTEPFNAETLYRRPVFNTRDEPHARADEWIRVHVIAGDANLSPSATWRKVDLVKIAIALAEIEEAPTWDLVSPVTAFQSVSRDLTYGFRIDLAGRNHTTAYEILESYFTAFERYFGTDDSPAARELTTTINECRALLEQLPNDFAAFARDVDWAAKLTLLGQYQELTGTDWNDPALKACDLEYHNIDPSEGLGRALQAQGDLRADPPEADDPERMLAPAEPTRAAMRGWAVARFGEYLRTANWRTLTLDVDGRAQTFELLPDRTYPSPNDWASFLSALRA